MHMQVAISATSRRAVGVRATNTPEEIYIGFPKNDYLRPAGRKGRVLKDDPAKYPGRDNQFTGGWAGGEAGLWKLREEYEKEQKGKNVPADKVKASGSPVSGKSKIYLGFGKDELLIKNTGVPGRVIYDDDEKYPSKEDIGWFAGIIGGFAGGEVGVKSYAETGQVRLKRKPGQPGGQNESPLAFGFIVLMVGVIIGVVYTAAYDAVLLPGA